MTARKLLTLPDRQALMSERRGVAKPATPATDFDQRHYSPNQLAGLWGVHASTIRRIFQDRPGVLKLSVTGSEMAHRYVSLRIPESVARQWYEENAR